MAKRGSPRFIGGLGAVLCIGLGFALPGFAAHLGGDGSGASNPDLLRGGYEPGCPDPLICGPAPKKEPILRATSPEPVVQQPVVYNVDCDLLDEAVRDYINCPPAGRRPTAAPQHSIAPQAASAAPTKPALVTPPPAAQRAIYDPVATGSVARPPYAQPVPGYGRPVPVYDNPGPHIDADWSLTLRGAYQRGNSGQHFGVSVLPEISISRKTARAEFTAGASAELAKEGDTALRLSGVALDFDASYQVNRDTMAEANASFSVNQDSPYAPGTASNVAAQPVVVTGSLEAALRRRFGRWGIEGRGSFVREAYSVTHLTSGATEDNSSRSRLGVGGAARLLYGLSKSIDVFVEGSVERNRYDAAAPALGARYDNWTYAVRAGVTGEWRDVLEATVSAGYGLRRFDSALLSDAPTALADAELVYKPGPVELAALFETSISAPDSTVTASSRIDYSVSGTARYLVNDRVTLRANLGGRWSRYGSSGETGTEYSAGVGADYAINKNAQFSADYSYGVSESTSSAREENHRVSVGLTYSR